MTFTLSIEETAGKTRLYGYHLGTIESIARRLVEEKMRAFVKNDFPIVTMALIRDGKIVDVLYPDADRPYWHSESGWESE